MLERFFRGKPGATSGISGSPGWLSRDDAGSNLHGATSGGIASLGIDELLAANAPLVRRIKLAYGTDRDSFDAQVGTLIRRYAEYVHLLPATPGNFFNAPGGLLQAGLEIGFYALQATDGQIFSGKSTITDRRELEPRWRHATFIAGLCSELHRALADVIVTTERGSEWPAYLLPLHAWLVRERASRFFLRWNAQAQESRPLALLAVPLIVPAATLQHLSAGNSLIVPHMMASIGGIALYRGHNIISKLVGRAAASVIERNLRVAGAQNGRIEQGSHVVHYLISTMRDLMASNAAWLPNSEKSRAWYARDGLYLLWPNAAVDIAKRLQSEELPGIPTDPQLMLQALVDAGVFVPRDKDHLTWPISPRGEGPLTSVEAAKLGEPEILLSALASRPQPQDTTLSSAPPVANASEGSAPAPVGSRSDVPAPPPQGPATPGDDPAAAAPAEVRCSLIAPMRLPTPLRHALDEIVATLNPSAPRPACCALRGAVFVPIAALEARGVDPAQAARALAESALLVPGPKTLVHDFPEPATTGFALRGSCVSGFREPGKED